MLIKFYREKNAKSIKTAQKRIPSRQELIENLILKLKEKLNHLETINNKTTRDEYLKKKNKYQQSPSMKESDIIQMLYIRVCVDIYELLITLSKLLNISLDFQSKKVINKTNKNMLTQISNLYDDNQQNAALQTLAYMLINLINENNFNINDIKKQMKIVQNKEGSFEKGLLVIFE